MIPDRIKLVGLIEAFRRVAELWGSARSEVEIAENLFLDPGPDDEQARKSDALRAAKARMQETEAALRGAERDLAAVLPGTDAPPYCTAIARDGVIYVRGRGDQVIAVNSVEADDGTLARLADEAKGFAEMIGK